MGISSIPSTIKILKLSRQVSGFISIVLLGFSMLIIYVGRDVNIVQNPDDSKLLSFD
jgi:hypothetical protein